MYHTIIIDDDQLARKVLKRILEQNFNEIEVMGEADSVASGLSLINDVDPDLVFLDINMPRMNGWEFLEEFDKSENELHHVVMVVMLTTSKNPDDYVKAKSWNFVTDFNFPDFIKNIKFAKRN